MPTDVALGAGYCGDALLGAFPGQYREPEALGQSPGAVSGRPAYVSEPPPRVLSDPDRGKQLVLRDIPGVGQVVVPVDYSMIGAVMPVEHAMAQVHPVEHTMVGVGHEAREDLSDWRASAFCGMGDLKAAIAQLFAGRELDELNSAVSKLQDRLIEAHRSIGDLRAAQAETERIAATGDMWTVEGPKQVPTAFGTAVLSARAGTRESMRVLTGFNYMTHLLYNVFKASEERMRGIYSGISDLLLQFQNWDRAYMETVGTDPEMVALWDSIQNLNNQLAAQAGARMGDWNDARYLQAGLQAVEQLTGVRASEASGLSGLGAEPVTATLAVIALVKVIIVVAGVVAVAVAAVKIVGEFNAVANNVHAERTAYEGRMEEQRKEFMDKAEAEGLPVAQATALWVESRKNQDAAQTVKEQKYIETAPSAFDIGKYIPWAAGAAAAVFVLPKILGLGSIGDFLGSVFGW